jgi:hypothetical protein
VSWSTLRTQVYNLINNNKSTLGVREVYNYPKYTFEGYPSVNITPSDNENDYDTTADNLRQYIFIVRVFYDTKNTGMSDAISRLCTVSDAIITLADQEDRKTTTRTVAVSLPSGSTYIGINAVPGTWGQLESENLIFCEVKIQVRLSVDVSV